MTKPMRRDDFDKLLKDTEKAKKGAARNMLRYLQGFVMLPGFRASTKKEAIERIVAAIAKECPNHVRDVGAATSAVLRREDSMSTGLDHGIAVPHGRDPSIHGIVGAVVIVDNSQSENGRCITD